MLAKGKPQGWRRFLTGRADGLRGLLLVAAVVGSLIAPRPAAAYRGNYSYSYAAVRGRYQQYMSQAALGQLNAAKQVLAAAESIGGAAQSKLDASLAKLREEATKFHEAQSITRHAAKELAEIETEILEEQKDDSPYHQAVKSVETARQKMKEVEESILAEPTVQSKLVGLTGNNLLEAKTAVLNLDDNYLLAKSELSAQGGAIARIRTELFQTDKHWKEAAESLTQARKDERAAEEMTHSGASGRISGTMTVRNASEAAAFARAAIAQAEAVLRANGGSRYLNSSSNSRNPTSSCSK